MTPQPALKGTFVYIDETPVPVRMSASASARRLTLRYDALADCLVVVRPRSVSAREALAFVQRQHAWIRARLADVPPRIPFEIGARIPILGNPHHLRHEEQGRRGMRLDPGALVVTGPVEVFATRVKTYLMRRAQEEFSRRAVALAAQIDRKPRRIIMRDPRSRWGSCSAMGDLSFSWRLIMAPEAVLSYVVAHEVAHLIEMNHSPRFWTVVGQLFEDVPSARQWLKSEGALLHRYG